MGITDFFTFLVGTVFIVLLPGPNSLYVITVSSQGGGRQGYRAAAGVFLGDSVLMLAAAAGITVLFHSHPWLDWLLRSAGALYLGWMGLGLLLAAYRAALKPLWVGALSNQATPPSPASEQPVAVLDGHPLKRAFLISIVNPKAALFFFSFFVQFVDPAYAHPALSFFILGVVVQVCSLIYLSVLIFGGIALTGFFRSHPRYVALGKALVGALFMLFAVRLLV